LSTTIIESDLPGEKPAINSFGLGRTTEAGIHFVVYKAAAHIFARAVRCKVMYNKRKHDAYEDYITLQSGLHVSAIFFPVSYSEIVYTKYNTRVSVDHQQLKKY
jgi:hypothetical protein